MTHTLVRIARRAHLALGVFLMLLALSMLGLGLSAEDPRHGGAVFLSFAALAAPLAIALLVAAYALRLRMPWGWLGQLLPLCVVAYELVFIQQFT